MGKLQSNPVFLLTVVLGMGALACASGDDKTSWPGWRGPNRNGTSDETGWTWSWPAGGPKIAWRASVGKGFSSLAVGGGRVYTLGNTSDTDSVFCLDAASGKVIWKHSYPCPLDPLAYEGGPNATPLVEGDRVYTLSRSGHCFCLNAASGAVVWSKKFEPSPKKKADYRVFWGFSGSPLLVGEKLILAVGTAGVALDKTTGRILWDNGPGRPGYSSPVPYLQDGRPAFTLLSGHEVVGVQTESGKVLWKIPWKTTWDQNAADAIVRNGKLFVSSGHGVGCAQFDLAPGGPRELWRHQHMKNFLSSSVLWDDFLYGFDDTQVTCLAWKTGKVRWSVPGPGGYGTVIVVAGKLVVLSERGELVIAEATPKAYKPLAQAKILSGRCWTAPAFAAGRLYARNAAGDVVGVDLRKQ